MRIKSERELLNQDIRKQIINEILSDENQKRRKNAYKRFKLLKDETAHFVKIELLKQFSNQTVERMSYAISNISIFRKIIDKLSRVYSYGVERKINNNELETKKLQSISKKISMNKKMKTTNKYLKSSKNACVYIKPCKFIDIEGDERWYPKLEVLNPHLYDVVEDYYNRTEPLAYILSNYEDNPSVKYSPEPAAEGRTLDSSNVEKIGNNKDEIIADIKEDENVDKREFIFWSNSFHFTCNVKGEFLKNGKPFYLNEDNINEDNIEEIENPILEMPFVNYAIDQDESFWSEGGSDLADGSIKLNSMITNMDHISIVQGYGQFYMVGKDLPGNVLLGPDTAITLETTEEDPTPQIGYLNSNPPLAELRQNIEMFVALLLTTNNLSTSGISTQLSGSKDIGSGIALIIDKSESQEDVKDQQLEFSENEPKVFRKVNKWLDYFNSNSELHEDYKDLIMKSNFIEDFVIEFKEPQVIISESERLDNLKKRQDLGIDTEIDLIKKDKPHLTDKQAEEYLLKILADKIKKMQSFVVNRSN